MEESREKLEALLVEHLESMRVRMRSHSPVVWSDLELTMPQARTLSHLSQGPRRMSQLSSYLGRGMPSATSMIDRLVKKGLVERVEDASDRRVVSCRLTSAGHEVVEQFLRMGRTRNEALAGLLTLEELRTVVPAMEILSNAAARRSRADQPEHPLNSGEGQEKLQTSSGATL